MSGYFQIAANLAGSGEPRRIPMTQASWDLFNTLRVKPFLGRTFVRGDTVAGAGRSSSATICGRRSSAATRPSSGKQVQLDGGTYTIIGVMPPDFHFPSRDVAALDDACASRPTISRRRNDN